MSPGFKHETGTIGNQTGDALCDAIHCAVPMIGNGMNAGPALTGRKGPLVPVARDVAAIAGELIGEILPPCSARLSAVDSPVSSVKIR